MCLQRLWSICLLPVVAVAGLVAAAVPVLAVPVGWYKDILVLLHQLLPST
jgi:uncharacterized membrane protein